MSNSTKYLKNRIKSIIDYISRCQKDFSDKFIKKSAADTLTMVKFDLQSALDEVEEFEEEAFSKQVLQDEAHKAKGVNPEDEQKLNKIVEKINKQSSSDDDIKVEEKLSSKAGKEISMGLDEACVQELNQFEKEISADYKYWVRGRSPLPALYGNINVEYLIRKFETRDHAPKGYKMVVGHNPKTKTYFSIALHCDKSLSNEDYQLHEAGNLTSVYERAWMDLQDLFVQDFGEILDMLEVK